MRKPNVSPADLVVLSLLAEEPMHGYKIVYELDRRDAKDWAEISRPQVYYSLKKLLNLKLIIATNDSSESLGPDRDIYRISRTGLSAMNDALSQKSWAERRPPPPFLTWMALSTHLPSTTTKKIIIARREFLTKELARECETLKSFEKTNDKMMIAGKLMVALTVEQFRTELKWLENVLLELPWSRS